MVDCVQVREKLAGLPFYRVTAAKMAKREPGIYATVGRRKCVRLEGDLRTAGRRAWQAAQLVRRDCRRNGKTLPRPEESRPAYARRLTSPLAHEPARALAAAGGGGLQAETPNGQPAFTHPPQPQPCGASSRAEPLSSSLEQLADTVQAEPGRDAVCVVAKTCRRHLCPCCGRALANQCRAAMHERFLELRRELGTSGDVQLWTLTVNPERYESPEAAWADVGKQKRVSRWAKDLGLEYWVCVLEWHKSGWPHWHVLVWKPEPKMHIDHGESRKAWKVGHVHYTGRYCRYLKQRRPVAWAINYVTKYITKPNEAPAWAWARDHIKTIWASRAWGPVRRRSSGDAGGRSSDDSSSSGDAAREYRSNREAVDDCGESVTVLQQFVNMHTGELAYKWDRDIPIKWRIVRDLAKHVGGAQLVGRSVRVFADAREWRRIEGALPSRE